MAGFRTAFVYLHAQAGPDYFADVPFAWTAGELRAVGLHADVIHVYFERDQQALQERLIDELVARVCGDRGYSLVVLEHCWLPELIRRLQTEGGALVCETEPDAVLAGVIPDFVLHHFTNHRQPLIDLVTALSDGADTDTIRNLERRTKDGSLEPCGVREPHPEVADARRPFCPITDAIKIGTPVDERGLPHPVRKTLDTNKGCPFSEPVRENPVFAGVSLDEASVTMAGCAFCPMGGDYKALPWRDAVSVHLDHIAYYQKQLPQLDEVVLRDQHAIRYVPALLRGAIERGLRPFGLLVPGRGDAILRFGDAMREASGIAEGSGFWWTIYLVGFESFSQPQLDLYNKGVTTAQYADALTQMRALHHEFADGFRLYAAGASSFILFSPWTTLDDLRANIDFCRDHSVWRLARGLTTTRMRLYPNLPLFHKARADGLLLSSDGQGPADDRGAAHTGYAAEAAWRYQTPEAGWVEDLHERLRRHCNVDELVGLLDACERFVRTHGEPDVDAVELEWVALRRLWKTSTAATSATSLPPQQRRERAGDTQRKADRTVLAGRHCNNRCRTCIADHAEHTDNTDRLVRRATDIAASGRLTIAGREPTVLRGLLQVVRAARAAPKIEIVTNGRALMAVNTPRKLARAGVTDVLIKRHRLGDEQEGAFANASAAGTQMWAGVERLTREAPQIRWRLLLIGAREGWSELEAIAAMAMDRGATGVTLRVMAAELDLAELEATSAAISAFSRLDSASVEGF